MRERVLIDDIPMAQSEAGDEQLLSFAECQRIAERIDLEHSLATTFCALQRERNAGERTRLWLECQRLAVELEKLEQNNGTC